MYWLCLDCLHEAEDTQLKQANYVCLNDACKSKNNFYPFTSKSCSKCKEEGIHRPLPIWALACEKCGEKKFILNGTTSVVNLKRTSLNSSSLWQGPEEFVVPVKEVEKNNTNQISLNLKILNNKFEIMLYGKGKLISIKDIIQSAEGFIPESIYQHYLDKASMTDPFIEIHFDPTREVFSFVSMLQFTKVPLTARFEIDGEIEIWSPGIAYDIPEGKLLQLDEEFFKIQLWVY